MGILSRFKDIMASNFNALLAKSRNPEKTINEYMNQLRSDLGHVKSEMSALETERDRAARSLNECEDEIEKFTRYAEKASAEGNSADARLYEQKKERLMPEFEQQKAKYDSIKQDSDDLEVLLKKLTAELAEGESRLAAIKGKMAEASALEAANSRDTAAAKKKAAYSADAAFNTLEDRANAKYDRAQAEAELNGSYSASSEIEDLASKYDD